jgi:hypothetical protein
MVIVDDLSSSTLSTGCLEVDLFIYFSSHVIPDI